ncbi:pyrimidine dimer DNA glycosylase/endonuclease V [Streptomyces sp. MS2A]|nr:pyrimidine dimer DNA glycosylase/endonuclease V [Streptomyces sp. MS2A]
MRLWSLHPRYLDRAGLVAGWREALLAQAVILAPERGYARHPQLLRFRRAEDPLAAIGDFLSVLADEADRRGYRFARERIRATGSAAELSVTTGQIAYEWGHLRTKLQTRSPEVWERWRTIETPDPHPCFAVVPGPIADWERVLPPARSARRPDHAPDHAQDPTPPAERPDDRRDA